MSHGTAPWAGDFSVASPSVATIGLGGKSATVCSTLGTSPAFMAGAGALPGNESIPVAESVSGIATSGSGGGARALRRCGAWKRRSTFLPSPCGSLNAGAIPSPTTEPATPIQLTCSAQRASPSVGTGH
jgi:hypothetical protein